MQALVKVVLVDSDPKVVAALRESFADKPEVLVVDGELTEQSVDAWVSSTTTDGKMDSALDESIKLVLGEAIERAVQKSIHARYDGAMPEGHATCVETARDKPAFLISTPKPNDAMRVALAASAALQVVHMQNKLSAGSISSIAMPGFRATGVTPEICADLMWTAYTLFREAELPNFETMSIALQELLRGVVPSDGKGAFKKSFAMPQTANSQVSTIPDSSAAAAQLKRKLELETAKNDE